jgi:hypothetical protein
MVIGPRTPRIYVAGRCSGIKDADIGTSENDALSDAARLGKVDTLRRLLRAGIPIDGLDSTGKTALMEAVIGQQIDAVRFLLRRGAKVDAPMRDGSTTLFMSAYHGGPEIASILLVHGANPNIQARGVAPATLAAAAKDYHDPGAEIALSYPQPVKGPSYLVDGKPGGFYMGAEYCPYCATERWPLVIALSKFGTWSGLETMKSSGTDVFPDTPTMTFLHATYVSKYFGFEHWELETRDYKTLQTPSAKAQSLFNKYNLQGGIPFVYLDGKYLINEVEYSPQYLRTGGGTHTDGISFDSALSSIAGGTSTLAANVEADAGAITADICQITHGQPGSVCKYFPKAITSKDATPGDLAANSGSG